MPQPPLAIDQGPDFAQLPRETALKAVSPFLFTGEDCLQVDSIPVSVNVNLEVTGTMLSYGLEVVPFSLVVSAPANYVRNVSRASIGSGWLLTIRVRALTSGVMPGALYVILKVCRGTTANAVPLGVITSGYVGNLQELSWPGGAPQMATDGGGYALPFSVTSPAAGADFLYTVQSGYHLQLISVCAQLHTSAAAGSRAPRLTLATVGVPFFVAPSAAGIGASLTVNVSWGAGAGGPVTGDTVTGGAISSPLPNDVYLDQNFTIGSSTGGLDVADTWTNIRIFTRWWAVLNI